MRKKLERLIPLHIKGVRLQGISVNLDQSETLPRIDVSVHLVMDNGACLTSISLSNASWVDQKKRLEPDVEAFEILAKLEKALIPAIHRTLNQQQGVLEHKE